MRKKDELSSANSCMAHAHPDEMVFVLLGRDAAAPAAIRAWADERVRLGKNKADDAQIVEARACADAMEREGRKWVGPLAAGATVTVVKKMDDLVKNDKESPLPISVIPNYMGINLCSVDALSWERRADRQLVSLTIHFSPEEREWEPTRT